MFSFDEITKVDPEIAAAMTDELNRQRILYQRRLWQPWAATLQTSMQRDILERDITADASMWML